MFSTFVLALALLQSATPQMGTPKPLTDEKPAKCSIEGKVISAVDGQALKKATLQIFATQPGTAGPIRPISVSTDGDGKFIFKDIEAGRYSLSVMRNGYARQTYGERTPGSPGTPVAVVPGQALKDIVIRLSPAGAISGRIVDEDNEPVANVRMQLARWGYMRGKRQLVPTGYASTDDRGQFRLYGIAAGRYFVSATFSPQMMMGVRAVSDTEDSYAPTYYPGTNDVSQAMMLTVRPGDDMTGISFRLVPGRAVRISGRVHLASGDPGKNIFLMLLPRGQLFIGSISPQSTDDKGNFSFSSVLPGSYALIAQGGDPDDRQYGRTDVDVTSSPIENIVVELGRGVDLAAEVHLDGDVDLTKTTVRMGLTSQDSTPMSSSSFAEVKEPGAVTLKRVADGNYDIRIAPLPEDAYVSKVEFDGKDALQEGIRIRGAAGPLSVTLSANGGHVDGSVVDSKNQPFSGATVALVPDEARRSRQDLFRSASTDQYGHFTLRGIPPGAYKVLAWEAIDPGAYLDPDFIKAYEDLGKTLQLGAGDHATPELKVIPSAKTGS